MNNLPYQTNEFPPAYTENTQDAYENYGMKLLDRERGSSDSGRESDEYKNSESEDEW